MASDRLDIEVVAVRQAKANQLFPPVAIFIFGSGIHLQRGLSGLLFTGGAGRKHLMIENNVISSCSEFLQTIEICAGNPNDVCVFVLGT